MDASGVQGLVLLQFTRQQCHIKFIAEQAESLYNNCIIIMYYLIADI